MAFLSRLFCFFLLLSPTLHGFVSVQARPWQPSRGGGDVPVRPTSTAREAKWSSYATVDPSTILSLLVRKAGFFLDPKLRSLADLMHCQQAKLNVVDRELLIHNFTVSLPEEPQLSALRIGRIHVIWDSYKRPCLEVEMEDVDVTVEFTNLLFTRNNWNELNARGFPPEIVYYNETTTNTTTASSSEYVRIGSLDFQGQVVLHLRSRPLQKAITEDIVLNLKSIEDLKYKIKSLAEANQQKTGRRGLTSDELYEVLRLFFNDKTKQAIRYAVEDLAASQIDPSQTSQLVNNSKQLLSSAKAALLGYASDIELLSRDKIKGRLKNWAGPEEEGFFQEEEVDEFVAGSLDTIKNTIRSVGVNVFRNLAQIRTSLNVTDTNATMEDEGPMFPDW